MTIEDFWNQAFLACLSRVPAEDARKEADKALRICLEHWIAHKSKYSAIPPLWQKQEVSDIFLPDSPNEYYPGVPDL